MVGAVWLACAILLGCISLLDPGCIDCGCVKDFWVRRSTNQAAAPCIGTNTIGPMTGTLISRIWGAKKALMVTSCCLHGQITQRYCSCLGSLKLQSQHGYVSGFCIHNRPIQSCSLSKSTCVHQHRSCCTMCSSDTTEKGYGCCRCCITASISGVT